MSAGEMEIPMTATATDTDRPLGLSLRRGLALRCPSCGRGHLMRTYLKPLDSCPACGEDLRPARADDGPAYLTILVVGHLMAPFIHVAFTTWRPDPLVMAFGLSAGCVALSLFLLPRMKGLIIGFQWARRMHGFGDASQDA
ncbi:hypothetical protein DKT77_03005 [Meridianimarinicoccus roseus]|uniref:DUF983 domain-containing protein n=2 Tax=Meridianimarinicoccus roseus TaxID=2072018 RepID=A0A2V2LGD1_9RHOB|nr:hypothetical protein DKT77_03005 [Meridianimarinicoccus roseus]